MGGVDGKGEKLFKLGVYKFMDFLGLFSPKTKFGKPPILTWRQGHIVIACQDEYVITIV